MARTYFKEIVALLLFFLSPIQCPMRNSLLEHRIIEGHYLYFIFSIQK